MLRRVLASLVALLLYAAPLLAAPVLGVSPPTLPHVTIQQDFATTRTLTLSNPGDAPLTFSLRLTSVSEPAAGGEVIALERETLNDTNPTRDPRLQPYAEYSGTHLTFGISSYGEILPFQYPIGNEHLRLGTYLSGYTLAYRNGTTERLAYAAFFDRSSLTPVSYQELENTPTRLRVRVVTRTSDNLLQVTRDIEFEKASKHVSIETAVTNLTGASLSAVVLKEYADWDVDGNFDNTFASDDEAHLLYARLTRYCGIASDRKPDLQDLDGWDDYSRRATDQNQRTGPVLMDGLTLHHFELGTLAPGASQMVRTIYAAANTLDELKGEVGFSRWLRADVTSGTIAPGASQPILLTYDATGLAVGDYAAEIRITSNAPSSPSLTVPATLTVTPDTTPPAAVDDLTASEPTPTSVRLEWTAVADSGFLGGPAASYDIRYSTFPISDATWGAATPVVGEPTPAPPGEAESFVVSGLVSATTYFFALRVSDDGGLVSALSNVATRATPPPPDLAVAPGSISDVLREGETATHSVVISNQGGYPLSYSLSLTETSAPETAAATAPSHLAAAATQGSAPGFDAAESAAGELIVRFAPGAAAATRASVRAQMNGRMKRRISRLDMEVWEFAAKGKAAMQSRLNALRKNPNLLYVQPNYIVHALDLPSDPGFDDLWGLHNTGQTGGLPDADIDAPEAWDVVTGSRDVVVAVIDTGIDYTHPDLAENIWVNADEIPANGVDDDGNGFVDDVHGYDFAYHDSDPMDEHSHGTHCAGTIGAVGNNGIGVVGVNHAVTIMAVKFLDDFGSGSTANAIDAVLYAVDNGAKILSNSWGGGSYSPALQDAIEYALAHDVLFVAAAGNSALDTDVIPNYPSGYDVANVISVAATDHEDLKAGFSNWGAVTVDLGAPGVDTLSTVPGGYGTKSGTSMATPHVSGAAALVAAHNPSLSALELKAALLDSVDPIAALEGLTVTGGRLNVANALVLAGPAWVRIEGPLSGEIPPGVSRVIQVAMDATGRILGDYSAVLRIDSTDPDTPSHTLPISLRVLPDCCAPAAIGDLAAPAVHSTSLELSWHAVGDDGLVGRASEYDVRYSASPLTEASWNTATPATGEPTPAAPGSLESFELTGIEPGTAYWIGVKTRDNSGQLSALSNVVSLTTPIPPRIVLDPPALSPVLLPPAGTTTRSLRIANTGEEELSFSLRIGPAAAATSPGGEVIALERETLNDTNPTRDPRLQPYAEYSGTHLTFGISSYGEILPFQYPIGNEHLRLGTYLSGYTLAYRNGTTERLAYAAFFDRSSLTPVSYQELENTPTRLRVRVVTRTSDNLLQVTRDIEFEKASKHVSIETAVTNLTGASLSAVVLKEYADWDVDGNFDNTFASDDEAHLLYARLTRYCGIASDRKPDLQDLDGWDDYSRRATDQNQRTGPVLMDGLTLHHFELGTLAPGASQMVRTIYAAANTLDELKGEVGFSRWLRADVTSGTIAPGASQPILLTYDATGLAIGDYATEVAISSNDPARPVVGLPAALTVANNQPPLASAGGPYVANEGSPVHFDASGSSDPDGDALQFRWDYESDGIWDTPFSSSPTSSFTWSNERTGNARLQVSDAHFVVEVIASVIVKNVAPTALDRAAVAGEDAAVGVVLAASDPGADILTYQIAGGPAHGVLSGTPPNLTYTPAADYNGSDSFSYRAHDGVASSNLAVVAISITPVNDPPVCRDDAVAVDEDRVSSIHVTSNDSAGPPDEDPALTLTAAGGVAHGTLVSRPDGTLIYTPARDYSGPDGFLYSIRDGQGLTAACRATIAVASVDDAPVATLDLAEQTLQYSDEIAAVTISASDVDSPVLTADDAALPEGLSLASDGCAPAGAGATCRWRLTGTALLPAGEHEIAIAIGDGQLHGQARPTLVVTREDARVRFGAGNAAAVKVVAPGGSSGRFQLALEVSELLPDAAAVAAHPGDIGLAAVSALLEPIGPGDAWPGICAAFPASGSGYAAVKHITCAFDAVPVNTYIVRIELAGGHYTGTGRDALTVYDTSLGFATGGGWFYWPGTADPASGYPGDRTTFGFVGLYQPHANDVRGHLVMVSHRPFGGTRTIKSTDLEGLSIGGKDEIDDSFAWAALSGKGRYDEKGPGVDRTNDGSDFTLYVEERGTAHAGDDRIWIRVENASGVPVPAAWMALPAPVHAVEIEGGNIVIPHQSKDHDSDGIASLDDNCRGTKNEDQRDTDDDRAGDACDSDDDNDGLRDDFEIAHHFDPLVAGEAHGDPDGDGLDNLIEQEAGTDPHVADSDGDGFSDAAERAAGSDPDDAASTPGVAEIPLLPPWGWVGLSLLLLAAERRRRVR